MLSMPRTEKESERKAAWALLWGSHRNKESSIVPDSVCWPYNTMRLSENLVTPVKYNLHQVSGLTEDKRIHESLFKAFNCTVVKLDTKSTSLEMQCFHLTATMRGVSSPCTAGVCASSQHALLLVPRGRQPEVDGRRSLSLSPFPCLYFFCPRSTLLRSQRLLRCSGLLSLCCMLLLKLHTQKQALVQTPFYHHHKWQFKLKRTKVFANTSHNLL